VQFGDPVPDDLGVAVRVHHGLPGGRSGSAIWALTRQALSPGHARGKDQLTPLRAAAGGKRPTRDPAGPGRRRPGCQTRPAARASRVRSARRRQPVLSRIRSRWELTVRTLIYSRAAICALVWPWATRVTSSRSRALSVPSPGRRPGLPRAGVLGEQQGVLGGGGPVHRRAAAVAVGRCISDPASQRRCGCGIVAGAVLRQRHLLDREVGTCSPRHFVPCEVPLK
jgi:hypothetical protein